MKKRSSCLLLVAFVTSMFASALAQDVSGLSASMRGDAALPLSSLGENFGSGYGAAVTFGQKSSSDMLWEGIFESARFSKGNADKLYFKDLSVTLQYRGLGVQGTNFVFGGGGLADGLIHPYVAGAVLATNWTYTRGAHATDTTGLVVIPELTQKDWSLNIRVGVGCEIDPVASVGIYTQVSYQILVGELWPTLGLRLEGVSAMQMLHVAAGVRVWL